MRGLRVLKHTLQLLQLLHQLLREYLLILSFFFTLRTFCSFLSLSYIYIIAYFFLFVNSFLKKFFIFLKKIINKRPVIIRPGAVYIPLYPIYTYMVYGMGAPPHYIPHI
jgi:hypothetical protein